MSTLRNDEWSHAVVAFDGKFSYLYVGGSEVEKIEGKCIGVWI
ncbi:hypothetical protein LCGC14_3149350, partial [marine sediment metagenome]